jgi:hypothetical protein
MRISTMIRKALIALLILYVGLLVGEIPVGKHTFGRAAFLETCNALNWTNGQLNSLVSYAGLADSSVAKWFRKTEPVAKPAPKVESKPIPAPVSASAPVARHIQVTTPAQPRVEADIEGLTPLDKEALRNILE